MSITVVLATYNGENYLRQQLDSIKYQTVRPTELIIFDDASIDRTREILQEYDYDGIKCTVKVNERNVGFVLNFEAALSAASGNYIFLSDQDDIWHPRHIEIILSRLSSGFILAYGNGELIDESDKALEGSTFLYFPSSGSLSDREALLLTNYCQGAAFGFDRKLLEYALPFPQGIKYHDHWLAVCAAQIGDICRIDDTVLYYRIHSAAQSTSHLLTGGKAKKIGIPHLITSTSARFAGSDNVLLRRFRMMNKYISVSITFWFIYFCLNFAILYRLFSRRSYRLLRATLYVLRNAK